MTTKGTHETSRPSRPEEISGAGSWMRGNKMTWLPDMDLNHDKQIQSLLCYRYTIGQTGVSHRLGSFPGQSSRQNSQPRRGDIFIDGDFHSLQGSVRSDTCRPAGAEQLCGWFNYKDFAPDGALN